MSSQKGFAVYPILILGIVLVIGFAGGYYFSHPKIEDSNIIGIIEESEETQDRSEENYEDPSIPDGISAVKWINYNDSLIEFSYPEDKPWDTYTGSPDAEPSFFDFLGSSGLVEMRIGLSKIPEETDVTFIGETSPKVLITKSRENKFKNPNENQAVKNSVTEIKETTVDGNAAYYYEFLGLYSDPNDGGFLMEKGECLTRAIFVSTNKALYEIVYCTEQPFDDIFKSIRLKE